MDTSAAAGRLSVDDLRTLVTVSPDATSWRWTVDPQTQFASPPLKLNPSAPGHEIRKTLTDTYADAEIVRLATSSWWDNATARKASSFANLFASAEDATAAMEAEREFARHWRISFRHSPSVRRRCFVTPALATLHRNKWLTVEQTVGELRIRRGERARTLSHDRTA